MWKLYPLYFYLLFIWYGLRNVSVFAFFGYKSLMAFEMTKGKKSLIGCRLKKT